MNEEQTRELMTEMEQHPWVLERRAQKAAEILEQRQKWDAEIKVLTQNREKTLSELQTQLAACAEEVEAAQSTLDLAKAKYSGIYLETRRVDHRTSNRMGNLQGELIASAPQEISDAQVFFREKFFELSRPGNFQKLASEGKFSIIHLKRMPAQVENNMHAIQRAMKFCHECVENLEKLKLVPDPDLSQIELMKKNIPSIDEFAPYQEPRPFANLEKGVNFLAPIGKSEAEVLLEKARYMVHFGS